MVTQIMGRLHCVCNVQICRRYRNLPFMTEDQLQAACWQWAWEAYPATRRLLWAVPNGGARNAREGLKLRATGVIPGVWDLHFFWQERLTFFELKVGRNRQSEEQVRWGALVRQQGATCYEIRTLDEFKAAFEGCMS